jgi:hypothetical protein
VKTALSVISSRLAVLIAVLAVALVATTYAAVGQGTGPGDDPATEPIPTLSVPESAQSIVATVQFDSPTSAQVVGWSVSNWPAPARTGNPPFIRVDVFDLDGNLIETFNEWHPLMVEYFGDDGLEGSVMEETGEGRFVFPFYPDVGTVIITDIELGLELVRIDAHQIVLAYCATSPDDPGCPAAPGPGPGQLPDTGGTSSDGGSGSWLWVAAIAVALTLAGAVGATWLARRRLSER